MIDLREIKEKARLNSVPESTIERDYVQNWVLKHLNRVNMVLKGGTGIRKVYIGNYRFSDDLDFTLQENISKNKLNDLLNTAIVNAKEESGINLDEKVQIEENINGFTTDIYFRIINRGGSFAKIKLDITDSDKEKILLPIETKEIIHPYSDNFEGKTIVYKFEEIIAEKIRALFERTRPRDLYDVWYFLNKKKISELSEIVKEKCRLKDVKLDVSYFKKRKEDFANAWTNSLSH